MFFSVEHLLGRNSNFSLVWRVAHTPDAKVKIFLTRSRALGIPIHEVCQSLMARIPSGGLMNTEVSSKFSLYLLGELLYGSVRILERQLFFLNLDALATCDHIKDILYSGHLFALAQKIADDDAGRKRNKRKAKEPLDLLKDVDLTLPTIQSMEQCDTLIGQAHLASITLQENRPVRQMDMFSHYEEDLMPLTKEQQTAMEMGMFDFEFEAQSREPAPSTILASSVSGSKNESGKLVDDSWEATNVKKKSVADALDPATLDLVPPRNSLLFENPFTEVPVDQLDNRMDQPLVDLTDFNDVMPFGDVSIPPINQLAALGTPKSQNGMTEIANVALIPRAEAASEHLTRDISLVLDDIGEQITKRQERRRRNGKVLDSRTKMSYEEMENMQKDYSSLLRAKDDLSDVSKRCTKINIYPQFSERPFCAELQYLYNPCVVEKMTVEDADKLGIFGDVCRGPEGKLWHYSESEQSSESEAKRSKLEEPIDFNMFRQEEFTRDPFDNNNLQGIAFLEMTPPRFDGGDAEMLDPLRNLRDGLTAIDNQMMDRIERPVSRASEIEEMRRRQTTSFGGLMDANFDTLNGEKAMDLEGAWPHGTSGLLQFSQLGMTDITQIKDDVDYKKEILSSVSGADEIAFSAIIPVKSTSRKQAARAFYCLLELTAQRRVFPTQTSTHAEIYIRSEPY